MMGRKEIDFDWTSSSPENIEKKRKIGHHISSLNELDGVILYKESFALKERVKTYTASPHTRTGLLSWGQYQRERKVGLSLFINRWGLKDSCYKNRSMRPK